MALVTAGLETFAKVRALHDSTTNPGEKASAALRMQTLARKAGMTVEQAVSRLDASRPTLKPAPASPAQAAAEAFNDFFNTPEFRAAREERERERAAKRKMLLTEYGSEDAAFEDTPMEAALRRACEPLLGPGETWNTIYRLDGWGGIGFRRDMPASVRRAVSEAWPLPATVAEAWAEFQTADKLSWDRSTFCYEYTPHSFVEARGYVVEDLLNTLPAHGLNDLRARLSWLEWWNDHETNPDVQEERVRLATLRVDIERMGERLREAEAVAVAVQSGQGDGFHDFPVKPCSPDPGTSTAPVHSGHRRPTRAERHEAIRALLAEDLTDREVARRLRISPTTVGTVRRSTQGIRP